VSENCNLVGQTYYTLGGTASMGVGVVQYCIVVVVYGGCVHRVRCTVSSVALQKSRVM